MQNALETALLCHQRRETELGEGKPTNLDHQLQIQQPHHQPNQQQHLLIESQRRLFLGFHLSLQQQSSKSARGITFQEKISIDKGEVVELFIELDELDESLLNNAVSFIRQRL